MKDYFLRDGGKLKKIGIKKRVRSVRYKLLMKIIWNSIMRILTKFDIWSKILEISKLFFSADKNETSKMATRINKYLSEVGYCSRREADRLVLEGKVTINGKIPEIVTKV